MTKVQRKENGGYQIPYRQTHTEEGEEAVEECVCVGVAQWESAYLSWKPLGSNSSEKGGTGDAEWLSS